MAGAAEADRRRRRRVPRPRRQEDRATEEGSDDRQQRRRRRQRWLRRQKQRPGLRGRRQQQATACRRWWQRCLLAYGTLYAISVHVGWRGGILNLVAGRFEYFTSPFFLGRIACTESFRCSVISPCVCWTYPRAVLNVWTDWHAVWGVDLSGLEEPRISWGPG